MATITRTSKLTDLKLGHDNQGYYLTAKYLVEDEHRITEITIPKITLPIVSDSHIGFETEDYGYRTVTHQYANIGFGPQRLRENSDGHCYIERIIKEKTTEMTIEEIEKKLGYKIKIVSEKK